MSIMSILYLLLRRLEQDKCKFTIIQPDSLFAYIRLWPKKIFSKIVMINPYLEQNMCSLLN